MISGILGIQIIGVLFGLLMVYVSVMHRKRKEFTEKESIFWIGIWVVFVGVTVFPKSIDFLGKDLLGVSRTMDFLIIVGFIVITGLLFYIYGMTKKNQKKLEQVVRRIAHERVKK
jgi:hypothetical protein